MKNEWLQIFFGINAMAALVGWAFWNILMLSLYKDENEKTFNLRAYLGEHWDNWAASLLGIPILLYMGHKGFNFDSFNLTEGIHMGDCYYVASGFLTESAKVAWKKWMARNS
jgi:hypothetical protein